MIQSVNLINSGSDIQKMAEEVILRKKAEREKIILGTSSKIKQEDHHFSEQSKDSKNSKDSSYIRSSGVLLFESQGNKKFGQRGTKCEISISNCDKTSVKSKVEEEPEIVEVENPVQDVEEIIEKIEMDKLEETKEENSEEVETESIKSNEKTTDNVNEEDNFPLKPEEKKLLTIITKRKIYLVWLEQNPELSMTNQV